MPFATWVRIAWAYHLAFAAAVTWPGQTLVNVPSPFVLGMPRQMAWVAAWLVGSLLVLWRMEAARKRSRGEAPAGSARTPPEEAVRREPSGE